MAVGTRVYELFRSNLVDGLRSNLMRLLAAMMAGCVVIHALLLPAQRTAGPAHFHLAAEVHGLADDDGDLLPHDGASYVHADEGPTRDNGTHFHGEIAHHDHSGPHEPVVQTGEADTESPQTHAGKVGVFDLTAVWAAHAGVAAGAAAGSWSKRHMERFRSHVTVPLDRPPRSLA